jgi:hypothetical protein
VAVISPGDFAAYVFTIALAVSGVGVVGAATRKIGGGRRGRMAMGAHFGDTDPGSQESVRQLAAELDALRDEVAGMRRELDESQNRLDFTERMLAQAKERGLLNAPKERGPS